MSPKAEESENVPYEVKQAIVVRGDLALGKGKLMEVAAHASLAAILNQGKMCFDTSGYRFEFDQPMDIDMLNWMAGPFSKVTYRADSAAVLDEVYDRAKAEGLITSYIISDKPVQSGVAPPPVSIAIGPARADLIDSIVSHLRSW